MDKLFETISEEMPGYLAAAAGSLGPGGAWRAHHEGNHDLSEARAPLFAMVSAYAETYTALGGGVDVGANDEVLISASRVYLLIKVDHRARRFLAVLLSSSGNIGYLRFKMRTWIRDVVAAG